MKYRQFKDNEWVQPRMRHHRMKCCDCGLVHEMDFRIHRGRIQFRAKRHARATASARRIGK